MNVFDLDDGARFVHDKLQLLRRSITPFPLAHVRFEDSNAVILLTFAAAALLVSLPFLLLKATPRSALGRLTGHKRIRSSAKTPPRSLSPAVPSEKSASSQGAEPTYVDVLPPSRRHTLEELSPNGRGALTGSYISKNATLNNPELRRYTPHDEPFSTFAGDLLTPTGFTVDEIRKLGDFPDYATLSGVPLPKPYEGFDIDKALPRPYRPLRWAYHQTMSLTKMENDWWLELENTYAARIRERQDLFRDHSKMVLQTLPGSEHACKELMEMVLQFLCARYPSYFSLESQSSSSKSPTHFHNKILNTTTDLSTKSPLHILLDNVPEDFALMLRNPSNGLYYCRAAVICSSLGWNVDTKIGKKLSEIHDPVPDYREKMQFSMDRYFAKKPTDKPIQRGSWGLEVDTPLFMPPGDPHEAHRDTQSPSLSLERCNLRVDWQTLRRLPLSGAVVFNFKALFSPVTDFADEAYIPSLTLKILEEGKENIMKYKNTWHTEHVVKPALKKMVQEQAHRGLMPEGVHWEPHTLDESPFFPGWEGVWKRRQDAVKV